MTWYKTNRTEKRTRRKHAVIFTAVVLGRDVCFIIYPFSKNEQKAFSKCNWNVCHLVSECVPALTSQLLGRVDTSGGNWVWQPGNDASAFGSATDQLWDWSHSSSLGPGLICTMKRLHEATSLGSTGHLTEAGGGDSSAAVLTLLLYSNWGAPRILNVGWYKETIKLKRRIYQ